MRGRKARISAASAIPTSAPREAALSEGHRPHIERARELVRWRRCTVAVCGCAAAKPAARARAMLNSRVRLIRFPKGPVCRGVIIASIAASGMRGRFVSSAMSIHLPQRVHGLLRRGERIVGAKQQAVEHAVLHGRHQRVVELPGPVVQRRDVRIQIAVLADEDQRLVDPRDGPYARSPCAAGETRWPAAEAGSGSRSRARHWCRTSCPDESAAECECSSARLRMRRKRESVGATF